jgi:DNA polymerase-3 subunit gamma/tau
LSRCLQFNLRSLPIALIADHLEKILASEQVANETGAVRQLARAAQGSMRDALSLLDQAIAFGGGELSGEDVTTMLGAIDQTQVLALLTALADADAGQLLHTVADMDTLAPDYAQVLAEMLHDLQRVAVLQSVPEAASEDDQELVSLSKRLSPEDVQLYYQIALIGRRDLPLAPDPRAGLEMLLLRMLAFRPDQGEPQQATTNSRGPTTGKDTPELTPASVVPAPAGKPLVQGMRSGGLARQALSSVMAVAAPDKVDPLATETVAAPECVADTEQASSEAAQQEMVSVPPGEQVLYTADSWAELMPSLALEGMAAQLASHCVLESVSADSALVTLEEKQAHLCSPAAEQRFVEALTRRFGAALRVLFRTAALGEQTPAGRRAEARAALQRKAEEAIASDPNIKLLQERFDATIRPGSIAPLDG